MPRHPAGERALTSAERQAKRRARFNAMRDALADVAMAETLEEARRIAETALEAFMPPPPPPGR